MMHVVAGVLLAAALLVAPGLLLARLGGVRGWRAVSAGRGAVAISFPSVCAPISVFRSLQSV